MKRHKPIAAAGRCCWVCGRLGGAGFTRALALAGYEIAKGEMAYAHPDCMAKAQKCAALRESPFPVSRIKEKT